MKTKKWMSHHRKKDSIIKFAGICLLLLMVLINYRCAKDRLVSDSGGIKILSVNSPDLKTHLNAIKDSYEKQKLQQKLQPDQSDKLSWSPDWEHPHIQVVNDSVSYVFYQLLGQVVVNGKAELAKQVNGKLYLMVKNESEFYKAFYYDPKADPNEKIGKDTKEFDLKLFTGNLILSSLQNGQNYILDYSNGHLSDSYQKKGVLAVKKMQSVKGTTSYWQQECNQVVRNCTYSSLAPSWCGGIVNIVFSATCSWPQSTCGDTYSLVDSDEGVVCEDKWFPDPPEPIDTGGGTGGSGDGTTTTTPEEFNQHINLDELSPCASSVMHSLMYQTEGSVVAMIQKISGEVPGYSWTLKAGNLAVDTNGETKKSNGGATTTIDVSKYTNGTDMALARTLLHEAVHAYLVSYFTKNNTLANLSYPEMLVEWIKLEKKDMNVLHHIEITTEFKSDIAKGLMEYGDLHNYTFSSTVEKNQFYSDMAWGGLEATPAYKALSNTEKNRIQDTIQAEQYGKDRNGDPKAGKGKPSGC